MSKPILVSIALLLSLPAAAAPKLDTFDFMRLGMTYPELKKASALCDTEKTSSGSLSSVSNTVCPTHETFAMATLVDRRVALVNVNWVSWDAKKLTPDNEKLNTVPAQLRTAYGLPNATIPYETQFGNVDADKFCQREGRTCLMHVWKSANPERIASLVFAKEGQAELPLLFQLSDLDAEKKIVSLRKGEAVESPRKTAH